VVLRCLLAAPAAGRHLDRRPGVEAGDAVDSARAGPGLSDRVAGTDLASLYEVERQIPADRPYVIVNMVTSLDGATAVDGVSKALGSPADRAIFRRLRGIADAVLVGAGTMRAEGYGPVRGDAATRAARRARGQETVPPVVVVSGSMRFDWASPFFTQADRCPIILTPSDVDPMVVGQASGLAEVITSGIGRVDLRAGLRHLCGRGIGIVVGEGGPGLNAELFAEGLVDELCLTVAPAVIGGTAPRGVVAGWPGAPRRSLSLAHALEDDGFLFLRYLSV